MARDESDGMGYGALAMFIGAVIAVIGIAQIIASVGIWRHGSWGRYMGLVVAIPGALLGAYILPTAFNQVYHSSGPLREISVAVGPEPSSIIIGLSFFAYLFVIIGLVIGGRHFRRRS